MPYATAPPLVTNPGLELKSYCEDRDFRAEGKPEPNSRSQSLIHYFQYKKWWIRVTFRGGISGHSPGAEPEKFKSKRERRIEFQEFVRLIDFQSLDLLDDTLTEVVLNEDPETTEPVKLDREPENTNRFATLTKSLRFFIREDPLRVIYPPCFQFPSVRAIDVSELQEEHEITDGVFRVLHKCDKTTYILKVVNRPLYQPRDSDVIQKNLKISNNSKAFQGSFS